MSTLNLRQAAEATGKSIDTIRRHAKAGKLPFSKPDGVEYAFQIVDLMAAYGNLKGVPAGMEGATQTPAHANASHAIASHPELATLKALLESAEARVEKAEARADRLEEDLRQERAESRTDRESLLKALQEANSAVKMLTHQKAEEAAPAASQGVAEALREDRRKSGWRSLFGLRL